MSRGIERFRIPKWTPQRTSDRTRSSYRRGIPSDSMHSNFMKRWRPRRRQVLGVAAALTLVLTLRPRAQGDPGPLRPDGLDPQSACGTQVERHLRASFTTTAATGDGEPLFFDQDPPLVFANHSGPITLRDFNVLGDYSTVQFRRYDPNDSSGRLETWTRVNSRSVGGRVISIFEPTWPASELAVSLSHYRFGVDQPNLFWGSIVLPNSTTERAVLLRMGIDGIPASPVIKINDTVQYASNVVNVVVAGFGDGRVQNGTSGFELSSATRAFYQNFADAYDVIALQPQTVTIADFGAFHQNVMNDVTGLNLGTFNQSGAYGSANVLRGVEVYAASNSARYQDTNHEMAHQWGSNFDWTRIANVTRAGHYPSAHAPLWTGGETLIGAVLFADRRVRTLADGYDIERTPAPVRYHPIEMYAMGQRAASDIPDFSVFSDQAQFSADTASSPSVATRLQGDAQRVSIYDVIRIHGNRAGPAPSAWRRALIVVSRDQLASQREMDFWNFAAQRLADRSQSNPPTYSGYASFRLATQNTVTLTTAIHPLNQPALPEVLDTATNTFGALDWRDVSFSGPVRSRFVAGESVALTGRVTATDPVDFQQISVVFYKADVSESVRFSGEVRRSGDFTVNVQFTDAHRGQYSMGVYLFWPNSGPQYSRSTLSTVTVQ
jgi:hypothetical protein